MIGRRHSGIMDKFLKKVKAYSNLGMAVTALPLLYFAYEAKSLLGGFFAIAGAGLVYAVIYYVACNILVPDIQKYVGETFYIQEGDSFKPETPVQRTDDPELDEYIDSYRRAKEAVGKIIGLMAFVALVAVVFWIFK